MIYVIRRALNDVRAWPPLIRTALWLAIVVVIILGIAVLVVPYELRLFACIGAFGAVAVIQISIMLGYRDMVTPLVRAQRLYLANDFTAARDVLEPLRADPQASIKALTLLGNTYRQLGDLDASKTVLYEAVNKSPEDQFPLYGIGRTLLADGAYAEAVDGLRRALANGAPEIVHLDLAEALWRAGKLDALRAELSGIRAGFVALEPQRDAMYWLLMWKAQLAPAPEAAHPGFIYWRAAAQRFAHTAYGHDLAEDLNSIPGVFAA